MASEQLSLLQAALGVIYSSGTQLHAWRLEAAASSAYARGILFAAFKHSLSRNMRCWTQAVNEPRPMIRVDHCICLRSSAFVACLHSLVPITVPVILNVWIRRRSDFALHNCTTIFDLTGVWSPDIGSCP
jgi:hypothetical protein